MKTFFYNDNYGNHNNYEIERKCDNDKYMCYRCRGYGTKQIGSPDGDYTETCDECHGTGEKYITIKLSEYDFLKNDFNNK